MGSDFRALVMTGIGWLMFFVGIAFERWPDYGIAIIFIPVAISLIVLGACIVGVLDE